MRTSLVVLMAVSMPGLAQAACGTGEVVINELAPTVSPGATQEWVELLAVGGVSVDVSGWVVQRAQDPSSMSSSGWSPVFVLPEGTILAAGVPFLVGRELVDIPEGADGITLVSGPGMSADMGNAGSDNSDGVRLQDCPGDVVDVVVYGGANRVGQVFVDEAGADVSVDRLAVVPTASKALARLPDGADTDNSAVDFVSKVPTPGVANGGGPQGPCVEGVPGEIVVNEFAANPDGTDSGQEWVELFHAGTEALSLAGWTVDKASTTDEDSGDARWSVEATLGDVVLQPGAWLVIAETEADLPGGIDVVFLEPGEVMGLGNGTSSADALRLADCRARTIDTVVYGGPNTDFFRDDRATVAQDDETAPAPASGNSLARRADGLDSDISADDFANEGSPTPGSANRDLACRSTGGDVVINEFLPDVSGDEGTTEFVELYNHGDEAVDVSTWQVGKTTSRGVNGLNATVLASMPGGTVIGPGAFLVVGGLFVEAADVVVEDFDLGSGAGGDVVWLDACDGGRVDSVLYGGDNDDGLLDDDNFVPDEGAPDGSTDQCIARRADGDDTNRSVDDFIVTSFCTPGATNVRAPGSGGTGPDPLQTGCGGCGGDPIIGDAPVVEPADPNGCATAPASRTAPALWVLLAAFARRRRERPGKRHGV